MVSILLVTGCYGAWWEPLEVGITPQQQSRAKNVMVLDLDLEYMHVLYA